jgi:hypothetical protein
LLSSLEINRSLLSSLLILFFIFVSGFSAILSEIFQAPNQENLEITKYRKLLNPDDLKNLEKISIKNNMGEFILIKDEHSRSHGWRMSSPRKLLANGEIIKSIVDSLSRLKIRYVYQKDKINLSNFSLNNPLVEITLENKSGTSNKITFGLINPIDRSTYAMISANKAIYHIDAMDFSLNSLNLTDLIDTRVFPHDGHQIMALDIFKGTESGYHQLSINKEKSEWQGKRQKQLDSTKVTGYLDHLFDLRSQLILDRMTEEQLKRIKSFLDKPQFTIHVKADDQQEYKYFVSQPFGEIPEMKLKKWQYVVVSTPEFHHAYILNKEFLKKLNVTENRLKNLDIKKLFY